MFRRRRRPVPREVLVGRVAPPVPGIDVATGRVVLYFLTASCAPCRAVWGGMAADSSAVAVTPGPETESRRAVETLAPVGTRVVMSGEVWAAYAVTRAPWRIEVADGTVIGDGPAV